MMFENHQSTIFWSYKKKYGCVMFLKMVSFLLTLGISTYQVWTMLLTCKLFIYDFQDTG